MFFKNSFFLPMNDIIRGS